MAIEDLPAVFTETSEEIREVLLAYLPERWSRIEGSWSRDWIDSLVLKATTDRDRLNSVIRQTFVATATGTFLDAHAEDAGTERSAGKKSGGTVRITALAGTVIPVNATVIAPSVDPSINRLAYQTLNVVGAVVPAAGFVDLEVIAEDVGASFNLGVGGIVGLETQINDVTAISNITPMTGGEDPEDDEALRKRLKDRVENPPGSGNQGDYRSWVIEEIGGVEDVAVLPLWDTANVTPGAGSPNGSVLLNVRGANNDPVDWSVVQRVQKFIDPSRQMIALCESGEGWVVTSGAAPLTFPTTSVQAGASALQLAFAGAGTTVVELPRVMDLSRFAAADFVRFWMKADGAGTWANINATSHIRFKTDDSNYYTAALSTASVAKPASGTAWWEALIAKSSFTATGTPSWSSIVEVELSIVAITAAVTFRADYGQIRQNIGSIGEGKAPIGHDVQVVTPVAVPIAVTAALTLATGYTLTGAAGTTDVTALVRENLRAYLRTVVPGAPVRMKDVENVIHDTPGVLDFTMTVPSANTAITGFQYPTLGTVTLT